MKKWKTENRAKCRNYNVTGKLAICSEVPCRIELLSRNNNGEWKLKIGYIRKQEKFELNDGKREN